MTLSRPYYIENLQRKSIYSYTRSLSLLAQGWDSSKSRTGAMWSVSLRRSLCHYPRSSRGIKAYPSRCSNLEPSEQRTIHQCSQAFVHPIGNKHLRVRDEMVQAGARWCKVSERTTKVQAGARRCTRPHDERDMSSSAQSEQVVMYYFRYLAQAGKFDPEFFICSFN